MRALTTILLALGLAAAAPAQSAHWDPPGGSLPAGQTTALQLVFEDCEPKDPPVPPKVAGLSLESAGQSTNMAFVNGTYSHSVTYSYAALLAGKQAVEIPSFEVQTNKGPVRVPAARFNPAGATVGGGQPLDSAAHSRLDVAPPRVWAGEVFQVEYTIQATRSYYPDFGHGVFDWNSEPLVTEDWSQPEPFEDRTGAEPQTGLLYRTRAIARKPGTLLLNPANQLVNLSVGVTGFGFFQQRQYQQFSVTSSAASIEARPLPPAPAGFSGAVGDFKLSGKVVPETASVGEPITWTLELSGTGNWPDVSGLPARDVSSDFQVIQPKAKRTPAKGKLFDSTLAEDVVLVPTRAGTYTLPPVRFAYFDPKSGAYQTLSTPAVTVSVTAAKGGSTPQPAAAPATAQGASPPPAAAPRPPAPSLPEALPRDPLPAAAAAARPLETEALACILVAPFLLLIALWLWLARQRARRTDPARPLREARGRLEKTLGEIRNSDPASLARLLLEWQRDSAELWQLRQAAPPVGAMSDPAWAALWAEADRAIYGADRSLPADWTARARTALGSKGVPSFSSVQLFSRRNLLPFLATILAGGVAWTAARALAAEATANPAGDYRRGDFAAAEKGWRAVLAKEPTAWTARHNLSLALAQQDRWSEAVAQAASAWVQNPSDEAVRWQVALACEKAGFVPGPLAPFLYSSPLSSFAGLASPAAWQRLLAVSAWLAAGALACLLGLGYGLMPRRGSWPRNAAAAALGLSLVLALTAALGWHAYGMAADSDAVITWRAGSLRSVPTEADTSQKTSPLPAGSIARAGRAFLGWRSLEFENGQTGWVRQDELVGLWR